MNDTNDDQNNGAARRQPGQRRLPCHDVRWVFPPNTDEGNKLKLEASMALPSALATLCTSAPTMETSTPSTPRWFRQDGFRDQRRDRQLAAAKDGTLLRDVDGRRLYAIDAATGIERGRFRQAAASGPRPSSLVRVTGSHDGKLHAGRRRPHAGLWLFLQDRRGLLMEPTLATMTRSSSAASTTSSTALDPKTGKQRWSSPSKAGTGSGRSRS